MPKQEGCNMKVRRTVITLSRWIAGAVFVFSGFVKGVDPAGSAIKFTDYFTAFGLQFMIPFSMSLAVLLILAEYLVGICLILGIRVREAAWGALLFMVAFLPFTLYLALFNPVSDCGCFGDALVLTNWETFFKNLFISIPVAIVFLTRKESIRPWPFWKESLLFLLSMGMMLGVIIRSITHLPLMDFRPYHIGSNLPEKMRIPEGAPHDEYETILVYEKNGVQQEFSLENYPWQDSTWTWVDTRTVLVSEGYQPPIHDFAVTGLDGSDLTQDLLDDPGYLFLLVSPNLEQCDPADLVMADSLAIQAEARGYRFLALTASPQLVMSPIRKANNLSYPFAMADETMLKTIIRPNPGLLLLHQGTVVNKWSHRDFEQLQGNMDLLLARSLNHLRKSTGYWTVISLFSLLLLSAWLLRVIAPAKPEP